MDNFNYELDWDEVDNDMNNQEDYEENDHDHDEFNFTHSDFENDIDIDDNYDDDGSYHEFDFGGGEIDLEGDDDDDAYYHNSYDRIEIGRLNNNYDINRRQPFYDEIDGDYDSKFINDELNDGYYSYLDLKQNLFHQNLRYEVVNSLNYRLIKCIIFDKYYKMGDDSVVLNKSNSLIKAYKYVERTVNTIEYIEFEVEQCFSQCVGVIPNNCTINYKINQKNKNNFLINSNLTPIMFASMINNTSLVKDLISKFNCDPNIVVVCKLSDVFMNDYAKSYTNYDQTHFTNDNIQALLASFNLNEFKWSKSYKFLKNIAYSCTLNTSNEIKKEEIAYRIYILMYNPIIIHKYSALMYACENENEEIIRLLLSSNADCNHILCENQANACIDEFKFFERKKNMCFYQTTSCLKILIERFNLDLIKILHEHGNVCLKERLWSFYMTHTHIYTIIAKMIRLSFNPIRPNNIDSWDDDDIIDEANKEEFSIDSSYPIINSYLNDKQFHEIQTYFYENSLRPTFNDILCLFILLNRRLYKTLNFNKIDFIIKLLCRLDLHSIDNISNILVNIMNLLFIKLFDLNCRKYHFSSSEYASNDNDNQDVDLDTDDSNIIYELNTRDYYYINKVNYYLKYIYLTNLFQSDKHSSCVSYQAVFNSNTLRDYFVKMIPNRDDVSVKNGKWLLFTQQIRLYINTNLLYQPIKLKQLCRLRIRSCMNICTKTYIYKLNMIPNSLKDYLDFSEL